MFMLVLEMMLGAVITPTFCEYMAFSVTLALVKPVTAVVFSGYGESGTMPKASIHADPLPQTVAQHAIFLFIAAGVNFRIHCDRRRAWLLLRSGRRSSGRRRPHRSTRHDPDSLTAHPYHATGDAAEDQEEDEDVSWILTDCSVAGPPGPPDDPQRGAAAPAAAEPASDPADWDRLGRDGYFDAAERA